MYYLHKKWLEQASIDSRISSLLKKRKELQIEIIHLNYEKTKALRILSSIMTNLYRAKENHAVTDLELALIDGRLIRCKTPKKEAEKRKRKKKKDKSIDVKSLSKEQRLELLNELHKMKGE